MSTIPPPPHRPRLDDTWNSRDFPVLVEVAAIADRRGTVNPRLVAGAVGLTADDVVAAIEALVTGRFLIVNRDNAQENADGDIVSTMPGRLIPSEKGRRAVGLWPSEAAAADLMLAQLKAIAAGSTSEDTRSRARRILDACAGTGQEIIVQVAASVITGHLVTSSPGQVIEPPSPTF